MYVDAKIVSHTLLVVAKIMEILLELSEDVMMVECVGEWASDSTRKIELEKIGGTLRLVEELHKLHPSDDLKPKFDVVNKYGKAFAEFTSQCDFTNCRTREFGTSDINDYKGNFVISIFQLISAIARNQETPLPFARLNAIDLPGDIVDQVPQIAIQYLFTAFEDYLRNRIGAGPEVYGQTLINKAFGDNGSLTYGMVRNEDTGIRNLISGAYALFRNPSMHRLIDYDRQLVVSITALVDLLIRLVDEAQTR